MNLTGMAIRLRFRSKAGVNVIDLTVGAGLTVSAPLTGRVDYVVPIPAALGRYDGQLTFTDAGGRPFDFPAELIVEKARINP